MLSGRVHLLRARCKHQIHPCPRELLDVVLKGARVLIEVFVVVELLRVDKDGDGDEAAGCLGLAYEVQVARMQSAHRGDECQRRLLREEALRVQSTPLSDAAQHARPPREWWVQRRLQFRVHILQLLRSHYEGMLRRREGARLDSRAVICQRRKHRLLEVGELA